MAELTIPTPTLSAYPLASYMQPFADPVHGTLGQVASWGVQLRSLLVDDGKLFGAAVYYDANNRQRVSNFSRSLNLSDPSFSGWSRAWEDGKAGFVSGNV